MKQLKKHAFKALLVDDDPVMCLIVPTILHRLGHSVNIAENGTEAIKLFTRKPYAFDVVITDNNMPAVSGLDLVEHLRKNGFHGTVVVFSDVLTSELQTAHQKRSVNKILQKTATVENLSLALSEIFSDLH